METIYRALSATGRESSDWIRLHGIDGVNWGTFEMNWLASRATFTMGLSQPAISSLRAAIETE